MPYIEGLTLCVKQTNFLYKTSSASPLGNERASRVKHLKSCFLLKGKQVNKL